MVWLGSWNRDGEKKLDFRDLWKLEFIGLFFSFLDVKGKLKEVLRIILRLF